MPYVSVAAVCFVFLVDFDVLKIATKLPKMCIKFSNSSWLDIFVFAFITRIRIKILP